MSDRTNNGTTEGNRNARKKSYSSNKRKSSITGRSSSPNNRHLSYHHGSRRLQSQLPNQRKALRYCNGSHRPEKCDKLKTVEERLAFLQQHKRCFNCAGFKHSSNRCKSKGRCLKCQRKHHTSICKDGEQHTTELKQDKSTQEGDHKPVHSGTTYAVLAKDH